MLGTADAANTQNVTYRVNGFSCPTCALGLDTILRGLKGVLKSKATYPDGIVTVEFDNSQVTEQAIIALILEQGFTVENHGSPRV